MKDIEDDEMKSNISVREAFGFPSLIERIMADGAAVYRNEDVFSLGRAHEAHMIAENALHPSALVVVRARAFFIVTVAALEAVEVKLAHISAYPLKILYELAVRRHICLLSVLTADIKGFVECSAAVFDDEFIADFVAVII